MELYYKLSDDAMGRCGEVAPNQVLNVPMNAVYAAPYQLYFKPRDARFVLHFLHATCFQTSSANRHTMFH